MTFHKVSTAQVIEPPVSAIIKQLNRQSLGEIVFHFLQLQGSYAICTVDFNWSVFISTAGSLQKKKTWKENIKSPKWITKHTCVYEYVKRSSVISTYTPNLTQNIYAHTIRWTTKHQRNPEQHSSDAMGWTTYRKALELSLNTAWLTS